MGDAPVMLLTTVAANPNRNVADTKMGMLSSKTLTAAKFVP